MLDGNAAAWTLKPLNQDQFGALLSADDDPAAALMAFSRLCQRPADRIYKTGQLGIADETLAELASLSTSDAAIRNAGGFFRDHFAAFEIKPSATDPAGGLLTGFYEPEVEASSVRTPDFAVPIYRRPDDLLDVTPDDPTAKDLPEGYRFARAAPDGTLIPYHDRRAIDCGALAGRNLEIAWLSNSADAFFIHVQGAALLRMRDGSSMRITYAAKSGHPFTGIGRLLVEAGEIDAASVSMQTIRAWLASNPDRAQSLMWRNQSYIFFRQTSFDPADPGPTAAAKVPLTPERSIATDRTIHTFGTPFFVQSDDINGTSWSRLMVAQDTGSAIIGPARADLYFGTGHLAGGLAGGVKARGEFVVLVPKAALDAVMAANRFENS